MLVVLTIVGVMAGVAVLGLAGADRGANVEAEARRLSSRLRLAADETMIADRTLALNWDPQGYGFTHWDAGARAWTADKLSALGERYVLPRGITLTAAGAAQPAVISLEGGLPLDIVLTGANGAWRVDFDGLNVRVSREAVQ